MLTYDSVRNRKPQAGSHPRRFCSEEWVKNSQDYLRGNAGSIVGDFQNNAILGNLPGSNPDMAALLGLPDGLFCVHHQIEQGLLNLRPIRLCLRKLFMQIQLHANIFQAQFVCPHLHCAFHDFVKVHWTSFALAAACE